MPTEIWLPGKVVWADLVTSDLESAVEFYSLVFGWKFVISETGDYAEGSYQGRMVGSIARFAEGDAGSEDARWLISISVRFVRLPISGGSVVSLTVVSCVTSSSHDASRFT